MAATHVLEDELYYSGWLPEPTPEAYGICSCCMGDGKESEYHDRTGKLIGHNQCGACGGDGKSVLEESV